MAAKLLTTREMEIFNLAVNLDMARVEDRSGATLGMIPIPTRLEVAKRVSSQLSFKIDEDDIEEVCQTITGS